MTQVTVYAGAIMVLFLFVIMLLGAEELVGFSDKPNRQLWPAIIFGLMLLAEVLTVIFFKDTMFQAITEVTQFGTADEIGRTLFQDYLLPFEVVAFLLLAAMIGAIVISRRVRQKPKQE
jgi:NADH-quinone oxidoreductase subunit J